MRVGVLRDVTRFLKSDWFALYAAKAAFSSREKAWLREASAYVTLPNCRPDVVFKHKLS